jgi:UDP-3-O-[3-hydroxymyristoyl] glucosamine N-acyltransferase
MNEKQKIISDIANESKNLIMGLITSRKPSTLTFLDSERFIQELVGNLNIAAVVTTKALACRLKKHRSDIVVFESEEPRLAFYKAYNIRAYNSNNKLPESRIHESSMVHHSAFVDPIGVTIMANVIIEPMVTVLRGVCIGEGSIIRAGSVIGAAGFEHKRVSTGLISIIHDRFVEIGTNVEIGANNTIARGLLGEDTCIGDYTKTDCLVHIAHCAKVGQRCLIPAAAMIAGSAVIGDDVWIGPNASISSQVRIGKGARVTIGSVVIRDVPVDGQVSGNFAVPHREFLRNLLQTSKDRKSKEGIC